MMLSARWVIECMHALLLEVHLLVVHTKSILLLLQTGNPCLDASMAAFKTAYARQLWHLGYAECSAVSLPGSKYTQLLQHLDREAESAWSKGEVLPSLLLQRDQLGICFAWTGGTRTNNAGKLQLMEVQDMRGHSLATQLQQSSQFPFEPGYKWQWAPNGTKPRQQRRAGVLPPFSVQAVTSSFEDPLRILHLYVQVRYCLSACLPACLLSSFVDLLVADLQGDYWLCCLFCRDAAWLESL